MPWNFHDAIFNGSVLRMGGVLYGGTWRILRVPDRRHGWQGHSWRNEWCSFTLRNIPWKFRVDISIGSVSGRGCQVGGTWRTLRVPDRQNGWRGDAWYHEWCSFTLRTIPWKFLTDISIGSVSRRGLLGGYWGFMTCKMDDGVIPDVMNDVLLP